MNKRITYPISRQQNMEFGLVLVLVCCLSAYFTNEALFLVAAIVLCLTTLLKPGVFTPFTRIWFKLSEVLGGFTSTLLLGIIFFCLVTPIAYIRRLCKKDSLQLHAFKRGKQSVLTERNHLFEKNDLMNAF